MCYRVGCCRGDTIGSEIIVQAVVALITVGGGFILGRVQSRKQILHEKQAEILVEYSMLVFNLQTALGQYSYSSSTTSELMEVSLDSRGEVIDALREVQKHLYRSEPWVDPEDYVAMKKVYDEAQRMQKQHTEATKRAWGSGDNPETAKEFQEWTMRELVEMSNDIQKRAEKRAGTKRRWKQYRNTRRKQSST